jgi:MerR family redox-sensitive transcriptional activator SoxR
MPHDDLTITEVARRAGIRSSAIRYYERIGLLPPPARHNGRRRYDAHVLKRLAVIATAQAMGFSIAEIGTLLNGFSADTPAWERWQLLAQKKLPEIDALIARATAMRALVTHSLSCECLSLEECAALLQSRTEDRA